MALLRLKTDPVLITILFTLVTMATTQRPRLLVFGGNGFIGSNALELLSKQNYSIINVNRGTNYWGWDQSKFATTIRCDRARGLDKCEELRRILDESGELAFDAIVDFSGYAPQEVEDSINFLRGRFKLYVYISTDSVYEVSVRKAVTDSSGSKETDAIRPTDPAERDRLEQLDRYGDLKLQCEEVLARKSVEDRFSVVAIRLPDVIGPRDTTLRWWFYQTWLGLAFFHGRSLEMAQDMANKPLSFVHVNDIARVIDTVLDESREGSLLAQARETQFFEAFNIGFLERVTMPQLLLEMAQLIGIPEGTVKFTTVKESNFYYPRFFPSVERGPVDISKAQRDLAFTPTPWRRMIRHLVDFYQDALLDETLSSELDQLKKLLKEVGVIENDQDLLKYISYLNYGRVHEDH